jgi:hypothetical protein
MMKRTITMLLLAAFVASLAVSATAATWHYVGTSAFTTTPSLNQDFRRIILNSIAVDALGNVYATATNGNNAGAAGGLTIFKAGGGKIDIDLNALGLQGGITKLVTAGDGKVYALQNWLEVQWNYDTGIDSRILRINPNGTVDVIYNAGNNGAWNAPRFRINGMAVGGDGNIYFTRAGFDGYFKYHYLWRYDVASATVEEAPINISNNGWSETHRINDLEYVGNNRFAVIKMGSSEWRADVISWTSNRAIGPNAVSNPGWGRDWCLGTAYDAVNNMLWTAARGANNRLILSRWNGIPNAGGLFVDDAGNGIVSNTMWHSPFDADLGTIWWVSALAADPYAGGVLMAYGINSPTNPIGGYRGHVVRYDAYLNLIDEGVPEEGADVVALGFGNGGAYALVLNNTTGAYSLYTTIPEPAGLLALGTGLIGLIGVIRRRK